MGHRPAIVVNSLGQPLQWDRTPERLDILRDDAIVKSAGRNAQLFTHDITGLGAEVEESLADLAFVTQFLGH